MNANHTTFLGRAVSSSRLRLRVNAGRQPILIVLDGKPIGALMPMAQQRSLATPIERDAGALRRG